MTYRWLFAGLFLIGGCYPPAPESRLERIAHHLCRASMNKTSPDHPKIVLARDWLGVMAEEMSKGYTIRITDRDEFGENDWVTHNVYIKTENWERGIRFRFDKERNQFHMVGFWTIRAPKD